MSNTEEEVDLTEELRHMLDERGIKYQAPKSVVFDMRTLYNAGGWDVQVDEVRGEYYEVEMERCVDTPEEAIATTLGNNGAAEVADETSRLRAENARLRELLRSYANSFEKDAAMNNGYGPFYSGEDWLALANEMRIDLAEVCGELGIEE